MEDAKIEDYIPHLSFDCAIFGFNGTVLKILILEYHSTGLFALPGGFIGRHQSMDDAVEQGVKERTGLDDVFLDQFYLFGSLERSQPKDMERILKANDDDTRENQWLKERFLTVGYYALINYDEVTPVPDRLSDSIGWYAIEDLPPLMMDHSMIVDKALETLRKNIGEKIIGMNLLPKKFTMKQLQSVYEAILGKPLRRTTFQRKMLSMDILERHEKLFKGTAHKAPYLYSFK